jgi:hypothetical protein
MRLESWLVVEIVPGVSRAPLKSLRRMKPTFFGCCIAGEPQTGGSTHTGTGTKSGTGSTNNPTGGGGEAAGRER